MVTTKRNPALVVVQLSGGNDAMNTVVPYTNGIYHDSRNAIHLTEKDVIKLLRLGARPNPKESLRYQVRKHGLPYVDLGRGLRRFRRADVEAFIQRKLVGAK